MSSAGPGGNGAATWAEWEILTSKAEIGNQSETDSIEEDYRGYRNQVNKETPHLTLDDDIKSECGRGYDTRLIKCDWCNKAFKICHLRKHIQTKHPDKVIKKEFVHKMSVSNESEKNVRSPKIKEEYVGLNNNATSTMVKKRSSSSSPITSSNVGHVPEVKRPKKSDETGSIFFSKRENPAVIFGEIDDDSGEDEHEKFVDAQESGIVRTAGINYINRIIKPLAYPRYGCYSDKHSKIHTYSSASRHLNQKLNLLHTNAIVQGMEELEGSSPMTPLSQPSPKLKVASHVRVQH